MIIVCVNYPVHLSVVVTGIWINFILMLQKKHNEKVENTGKSQEKRRESYFDRSVATLKKPRYSSYHSTAALPILISSLVQLRC